MLFFSSISNAMHSLSSEQSCAHSLCARFGAFENWLLRGTEDRLSPCRRAFMCRSNLPIFPVIGGAELSLVWMRGLVSMFASHLAGVVGCPGVAKVSPESTVNETYRRLSFPVPTGSRDNLSAS